MTPTNSIRHRGALLVSRLHAEAGVTLAEIAQRTDIDRDRVVAIFRAWEDCTPYEYVLMQNLLEECLAAQGGVRYFAWHGKAQANTTISEAPPRLNL